MKRYKLSVILLTVMLMCIFCSREIAHAKDSKQIEVMGVEMPAFVFEEHFKNGYTDILNQVSDMEDVNETTLTLSKVKCKEDSIKFELRIADEKMKVHGTLYAGFESAMGKNSIVGKLDTKGEYQILYFEIFNDTQEDYLMLDCSMNGVPHMKMYILDSTNDIHVYEMELPEQLKELSATELERCESDVDIFWARGILDLYQFEEKETDFETLMELGLISNKSRALNAYSIYTFNTYTVKFWDGGNYYNCVSLPYLEYKHVNVGSADATWTVSFKIAEHCTVDGAIIKGAYNPIRYQDISLKMVCGANTTFVRSFVDGRLYECRPFSEVLKSTGSKISAKILKKLQTVIPHAVTLEDLNKLLKKLESLDTEITLGGAYWEAYGSLCNAIGVTFDSHEMYRCTDYDGKESGHYVTLQGVLQYEGNGTSTKTNGMFAVNFNVFNCDTSITTPVEKKVELVYTASP